MNCIRRISALAGALLLAAATTAQSAFPEKTVRLVVPFPPGGTTDVVARKLAAKMADVLRQPVIIENKGGAGATIGTELVAKAPADGYTLLMATNSHTVNPYIYTKLSFNTAKDFAPVALVADSPSVLCVHPSNPAATMKAFVDAAKTANPPFTFGTAGAGTYPHLTTELFMERTGIKMTHIPYKGAGPALTDLLGGVYTTKWEGIATALPHLKAGKLKPLAVSSLERLPQLPDVPTVAELGYPGFETNFWMALLAPAGTPKEALGTLERAVLAALKDKELSEGLAAIGVRIIGKPGSAADELIRREMAQWPDIVKRVGISAN
jgi:tripartite-type tricarboxylate transporter receptor subunit TctC